MAPADQAGAVVRRRTIFFGLGGGGAAAVLPSSSAAAAFGSGAAAGSSAGAALEVAACLLLPLVFAAWFDFGSSDGGAAAAAAAAAFCWSICSCAEPLYKFFGTPCSRPGTPSGNTGLRSPGSFFLVSSQSSRSLGSKLLMPPVQPASAPDSAMRTAAAIRRCERRMGDFSLNSVFCRQLFATGGSNPCSAQPRQNAIPRRRLRSQVGKGSFSFGMLVLLGELDGLVECSSGFRRPLRFQVLVATPAAHGGDDQQRAGNDIDRILVPQLFEPLATYLFVDFIK